MTRIELEYYNEIKRQTKALESIAKSLEQLTSKFDEEVEQ